MKTIHTSAPAKIILFGEHASRHEKASIVFAINQRMHIFLKERKDDKILLSSPELKISKAGYPCSELTHVSGAIKVFLQEIDKKMGFELETKSEMIEGFGSSAAVTVATLGALNEFFETNFGKEKIYELGCKTIWEVQGFGSGIDIAAATYGGIILFKKNEVPKEIPFREFPIVIGNTGVKAKSKPIIEAVQILEKKYPRIILDSIMNSIEIISWLGEKAIKENDLKTVGELMNINHGLLYSLGVSSDVLEKLVFAARKAGALGAKLSGAGVGDNMIAIAEAGKEKIIAQEIEKAGGKPIIPKIDVGLKRER